FPCAGARRRIDDDRPVAAENLLHAPKHPLAELGEIRAAMVDHGHVDRPQDTVGNLRGSRNLQEMSASGARHRIGLPKNLACGTDLWNCPVVLPCGTDLWNFNNWPPDRRSGKLLK